MNEYTSESENAPEDDPRRQEYVKIESKSRKNEEKLTMAELQLYKIILNKEIKALLYEYL
jgi:hypothetical protein